MCKTRSQDNTAATEQTDAQQPSLRGAGCDAATLPVVAAEDARTMLQILSRDQRTTYHRLASSGATGSGTRAPATRQPPAQSQKPAQPSADTASSASPGFCPLPEILGLIGDSVSWHHSRAKHHDRDELQRCRQLRQHQHPPATARCFDTAKGNNRTHKAPSDVAVDVERQLQPQRTCKVQSNSCVDSEDDNIVVLSQNDSPASSYCQPPSNTYRNKSRVSFVTWLRLVGLLVALLLVSVESAPTAMTLESRRLDQAPKWLNPCGFAAEEFEGDIDVVQLNDATLLGNIVMQAKTALNYAHGFRDDFIKKTFNTDYADLHLTWKDNHYDWLPGPKQIPKMLGEHLDQDYLHKLEVRMLDTALLDAYEYMQRYAVGLEQIAWDQEDYALDFRKQFKDTEYNLRSVLCELQMALAERGVTPRADVTRDVMSVEFRDMSESATYRNLRDWLIFRDYMNGLEYVVQVFEHFIRCFES
ncbi:uncharacterized protein LOC131664997 isoform X2 [Phymastichus coffea]|uniref:uncharacterized protein LOC131664997 isoform X2 n=1 Tax=Phymastichus coffea TaxID=108790 RepID=UPI00273C260B|nr:uncharacterized protein LOC131664997 isoform X2 [Phymastichus coffea]